MNYAYLIIPLGAIIGTLCRWKISVAYNNLIPFVPLGTLIVNLVGSYLIGLLLALPATMVSPVAKSWISIGFLGGLTTFSAFSAEVMLLLTAQQYSYALFLIASHLIGSLLMTGLGMYTAINIFGR